MNDYEKKEKINLDPVEDPQDNYLYRWDYTKQAEADSILADAREKRSLKTYIAILASAFGVCLLLLVGVLVWYQLAGGNRTQGQLPLIEEGTSNTAAVSALVTPSTVLIQCGEGYGTGFFIRENGYIATNYHVVSRSSEITVRTYDGKVKNAVLRGYSAADDLAVLKIDGHGYPAVSIGNSDSIQVGDTVIAIGNPSGVGGAWSTTQGIISSLKRAVAVQASDTDSTVIGYATMMQTDATLNPGNSGGPLCNTRGEVIGVVTRKSMSYEGMGYALPINGAMVVLNALMENGNLDGVVSPLVSPRPFLGITATNIKKGDQYTETLYSPCDAVYVVTVQKNGAANGVLEVGDIILSVDGRTVSDMTVLLNILNQYSIGDRVTLKILRDGQEMNVTVALHVYSAE